MEPSPNNLLSDENSTTTTDKGQETSLHNEDFSSKVPFSSLCELYERVSHESALRTKRKLVSAFLSHYLDQYYPIMRLLLPKLDKERTYGVKEASLAGLYMECLGIARDSEDGKRLIEWRKGKV